METRGAYAGSAFNFETYCKCVRLYTVGQKSYLVGSAGVCNCGAQEIAARPTYQKQPENAKLIAVPVDQLADNNFWPGLIEVCCYQEPTNLAQLCSAFPST